jgi:hypothetical protein
VAILSAALNLSTDYVKKNGGAWLVNVTRQPNYSTLTIQQQELLNKQIDKMIANKYTIIGYNGLRTEKLREMTDNFKINLFDDAVVIVDEAHNLISRIVNKLNKSPEVYSYGEISNAIGFFNKFDGSSIVITLK